MTSVGVDGTDALGVTVGASAGVPSPIALTATTKNV